MKPVDFLLKVKVAVISASSFFSIATFLMIALSNRTSIEQFMPFWMFGLLMLGLVFFNWEFLISREGGISARKNDFNVMVEQRLERIEKALKDLSVQERSSRPAGG